MVEKVGKSIALPGPMDWHVLVPKDMPHVKARFDGLLFDSETNLVKMSANGVVDIPPAQAGTLWRFRPFPQGCAGSTASLEMEGIQPYLAPYRDQWWDTTLTGSNPSSPFYDLDFASR